MVRKRKGHPRSVVKIVKVHPKHSKLISMVPTFAEVANILESTYFMITVALFVFKMPMK